MAQTTHARSRHRSTVPVIDARRMVNESIKVLIAVQLTPHVSTWFVIDKHSVLAKLDRMSDHLPICCELEADGWCWLGVAS